MLSRHLSHDTTPKTAALRKSLHRAYAARRPRSCATHESAKNTLPSGDTELRLRLRRIRFCNSGAEATLHAARIAPSSGMLESGRHRHIGKKIIMPWICVGRILRRSYGAIPARPSYLRTLREVTKEKNVILIFDEVRTFRLSEGGAQRIYGIDLILPI